jgi:hypothetical protein
MRVFCHEHKRGFFAPRQSPIKCENSGHVLGELDFLGQDGGGKSAFPFQWQYCCNCEHFCVIDFDDAGLQRCPVCTRRSSILYLCDRCYTVSFESNTPLETKNFTLTAEGMPSPCCPGCLHPAAADLREHSCDDVRVSFVTALNSCPVCNERLDIGPAFPSPVAQYLKRTKSANKLFVTFDYESGLFASVEDGEFVLISNNDETSKTFVIPRSPKLTTLRDFYELYQDYYHCAAPAVGEITISEPAVVVPMGNGWKLLAPGVFLVAEVQPKKMIPPAVTSQRANTTIPQEPPAAAVTSRRADTTTNNEERRQAAVPSRRTEAGTRKAPRDATVETDGSSFADLNRTTPAAVACTYCDTLIEAKYAFCWKCGSARAESVGSSRVQDKEKSETPVHPPRSRLIVQATEEDEDSQTVQHPGQALRLQRGNRSNGSELFKYSAREMPALSRSVLKLFAIAAVSLLLISLAVLAIRGTGSSAASPGGDVAVAPSAQTNATPQTVVEATPSLAMKPVALRTSSTEGQDKALEQLRQMRRASDRSKVLKNLSETETKYADDYRFPYERARVVVLDHKKNFQEEAFAALARAAQKAINKGKSGEMLESLNKDSEGDFQKLAHGRREWTQLQKALKSKNASVLPVNEGL